MIQKCDFFRYLIVYHYGGFYLDLDILLYKNLDSLNDRELCLFNENILTDKQCLECGHPQNERERVANYVFGSIPKHPFCKNILDMITSDIKKYKINKPDYRNYVLETTGPGMLTRKYHLLKPSKLIYPTEKSQNPITCSCKNDKQCRVGNFGDHLHLGSWNNMRPSLTHLIVECIENLGIVGPSIKHREKIINYLITNNPYLGIETIEEGLKKYWLTK